jgi:hypothetical protein
MSIARNRRERMLLKPTWRTAGKVAGVIIAMDMTAHPPRDAATAAVDFR